MLQATALTLAKLIKEKETSLKFAVGSGLDGWDNISPPKFPDTKKTLYTETHRGSIQSITYADPATLQDSATPTSTLKIVFTIPQTSVIDGTNIREKAIYIGGETKDSGDLLHAESTALEVKVNGKEFQTTMFITVR
jgi:hypothetical protein